MSQGLQNSAKNAVEKIGFVVDPTARADKCLKHLLVQFKKRKSVLRKLTIPASEPSLSRYCCCIFVMSILAYRRARWGCRRKEADWPQKEPIEFPLTANVNTKETRRERFLYRFMVIYYYNLMKDYKNRYVRLCSEPELCKLRDNIISIFEPTKRSYRKFGVEGGKAVNLFAKEHKEKAIEQTVYFWKKEDFPRYDLDESDLKQIAISNGPPATSIKGEVLDHILNGLHESDFWKKWEKEALAKQNAIKPKGNTEKILRNYLKEEANRSLSYSLHGRKDYKALELEAGHVQTGTEQGKNDMVPTPNGGQSREHNREWGPFNWRSLLDPGEVFILSCNLGRGKTTFLRHLQSKILEQDNRIPIFIEAPTIEKWDFRNEDTFISCLSKEVQPWLPKRKAVRYLKRQLNGKVLLLVDQLDKIEGVGTAPQELLGKLTMFVRNGLIIASRPSAVTGFEDDQNIKFLRLRSLSQAMQLEYFGDGFERACQMCKSHQWMLGVPLLAFMVRSLIKTKQDWKIMNRANLYKQFVDRIFTSYKHGDSKLSKGMRGKIRWALQKIAYDALADGNFDSGKIPSRFCQKRISDLGLKLEIDDLPRCGIVKFTVDRNTGSDECLSFEHPSFQEYLAAEWACEDEARIELVLGKYWNPKWQETLKFLSGLKEEADIVKRIYPGAESDNPMYSRLFLAAQCAGEAHVDTVLEKHLIDNIIAASEHYPFEADALKALIGLGTARSLEHAWNLFKEWEKSYPIVEQIDTKDLLVPLFLKERLQWAIDTLFKTKKPVEPAIAVLQSWAWAVEPKTIDRFIHMLRNCNGKDSNRLTSSFALRALSEKLRDTQIGTIAELIWSKALLVRWGALHVLEVLGNRLDEKQIMGIIDLLDVSDDHSVTQKACTTISRIAEFLSSDHERAISRNFWSGDPDLQETIAKYTSTINRKFRDDESIENFIKALETSSRKTAWYGSFMLKGISSKLPDVYINKILGYIDSEDLSPIVITVISPCPKLNREQAVQILDKIDSKNDQIRRASLQSVRYLKAYISQNHVDTIMRSKDNYLTLPYTLEACSYVPEKIGSRNVWKLVCQFVPEDKPASVFYDSRLMDRCFSILSKYLSPPDHSTILRRLMEPVLDFEATLFVPLIDVERLANDEITKLADMLSQQNYWIRPYILKKLRRVHESGHI